jgi:hypothetical protein
VRSGRGDYNVLLGDFFVISFLGVGLLRGQPLAKCDRDLRLQGGGRDSGLEAAEGVKPVGAGLLEDAG